MRERIRTLLSIDIELSVDMRGSRDAFK